MKIKFKYLFLIILLLILIPSYHKKNIVVTNKQDYLVGKVLTASNNVDKSTTLTYKEKRINGHLVKIEDDADLLNEHEEKLLLEKMEEITKYGNVVFKSIRQNPSYNTEKYAEKYYHENFSLGESGTLFLIDMHYRVVYIFSDGAINRIITTAKANTITDNVYRYASRGEYYACAEEAFNEINTLLDGGKISEPMKYITNTILSLVIAALLGFLLSLKKASLKKPSSIDIANLLNKKIKIEGDITVTKTGQKSIYRPSSSSSSSGGISHSSGGGGHSSGSGGGHRF